jgi:hypothetical protein
MGTRRNGAQTTIANRATLSGVGVHSGHAASVTLHPAEADSGIYFYRTNLDDGRDREIPADYRHVSATDQVRRRSAHRAFGWSLAAWSTTACPPEAPAGLHRASTADARRFIKGGSPAEFADEARLSRSRRGTPAPRHADITPTARRDRACLRLIDVKSFTAVAARSSTTRHEGLRWRWSSARFGDVSVSRALPESGRSQPQRPSRRRFAARDAEPGRAAGDRRQVTWRMLSVLKFRSASFTNLLADIGADRILLNSGDWNVASILLPVTAGVKRHRSSVGARITGT